MPDRQQTDQTETFQWLPRPPSSQFHIYFEGFPQKLRRSKITKPVTQHFSGKPKLCCLYFLLKKDDNFEEILVNYHATCDKTSISNRRYYNLLDKHSYC
jgi:hypothetical protein